MTTVRSPYTTAQCQPKLKHMADIREDSEVGMTSRLPYAERYADSAGLCLCVGTGLRWAYADGVASEHGDSDDVAVPRAAFEQEVNCGIYCFVVTIWQHMSRPILMRAVTLGFTQTTVRLGLVRSDSRGEMVGMC